jgi:iron complex outermembrane recepter protein
MALGLSLLGLSIFSLPLRAQANLSSMSLEDLLNVEVTSVSKTQEKLSQTASAIYVITQEDIRDSGAANIPDVLRMVPGMDVAQINSNTWAISARSFNGRFSNELLVLVDGRTVYTPTFGGVFWDVLDLPLEDIERIEVIRGPGGSVWGANAVNGVVNVITKKAGESKGAMVVAGGSNLDQGFATLQYGAAAGKTTDYRVYSKYFNQDHLPDAAGANGEDGWRILRGGFRVDSSASAKDSLSFQGDVYSGQEGQTSFFLPSISAPGAVKTSSEVNLSGGFLQSVWNHVYSARSDTTLQVYYDRYTRNDVLMERRGTFNIDFSHHLAWGDRQSLVWGLGYRYSASTSDGGLGFSLDPPNLDIQLFSSFAQDEIALVRDRLYLTVGTKLEHNYYTGFGLMPSLRAAWLLTARQTLWAAFSRSLRTPAATDESSRVAFAGFIAPGGTPAVAALVGNPAITNEKSHTYEIGYRATLSKRLLLDISAYYNDWGAQETTEPSTPFFETTPAPAHLVLPLTYQNLMYGESHGFEVFGRWRISDRFTLSPGYAFERVHMQLAPPAKPRHRRAMPKAAAL